MGRGGGISRVVFLWREGMGLRAAGNVRGWKGGVVRLIRRWVMCIGHEKSWNLKCRYHQR